MTYIRPSDLLPGDMIQVSAGRTWGLKIVLNVTRVPLNTSDNYQYTDILFTDMYRASVYDNNPTLKLFSETKPSHLGKETR